MLSREQLQRAAADSGFQVESYEKVHVFVRLLEAVRTHPFLGMPMALKGGTALNLFVLGLERTARPSGGHHHVSGAPPPSRRAWILCVRVERAALLGDRLHPWS